jgi:multidrug resistance efflux pump
MMRRRPMGRRPLARAAVIGGAGYMAGKSRAKGQAAEQEQNQQIADLQAQQAAQQQGAYQQVPAAAPVAGPAPDADPTTAELQRLAGLHSQGILTDEEFAAAKAKVLGI